MPGCSTAKKSKKAHAGTRINARYELYINSHQFINVTIEASANANRSVKRGGLRQILERAWERRSNRLVTLIITGFCLADTQHLTLRKGTNGNGGHSILFSEMRVHSISRQNRDC
jgi:hypothetical protein